MEEGTKILATIDGILRTITESSLRRNLKLKDEEGISSLPDVDLFENLTLIGYNISPNQKFTFQKDEPTSPLRDVSEGEAYTIDSGFEADQDRANIANLQRQHSKMVAKFKAQELEIHRGGIWMKGAATERVSDDTEEMATVLTSMDVATVLSGGVTEVLTGSGSIPTAGPPAAEVPTGSDVVPTAGLIFATATVVTPYTRRKGKETMVESETLKKKKTQQRKPWSKKQKRDYYMAFIKSNLGWKEKAERFKRKGIRFELESVKRLKTSEEVPEEVKSPDEVPEEKVKEMMQLVPIEEVYVEALQFKHPIIDWKVHTEGQRRYWKITRLGDSSASYQFFVDMLKHLDREDLNQLWALVKESLSNRPPTSDKEMELWVELKRLYEPDNEDQLWTHTQNLVYALVEWKLYDTCGVHHVTAKDKEIFMLVEKDYPFRKGLAIGMISYKLQVENYSKMANDLILKIYKIASSPSQQGD
nr:hypothetical protein [Tanacetum cinerariifolium]